jgi:hypothetical protein
MRTDSAAQHYRSRIGAALRLGVWSFFSLCLVLLLPDTITWPVALPGPGTTPDIVPIPVVDLYGAFASLVTYPAVWGFCVNHLYLWLEIKEFDLFQFFLKTKADGLSFSPETSQAGVTGLNHLSADLVNIRRSVGNWVLALYCLGIAFLAGGVAALAVYLYQLQIAVHASTGLVWAAIISGEIGLALLRITRRIDKHFPHIGPPQADIDNAVSQVNDARTVIAYANGPALNLGMLRGLNGLSK